MGKRYVMTSRWAVYQVMKMPTPMGAYEVETVVAASLDRETAFRIAGNFGQGVRVREDTQSVLLDEHGLRAKVQP